MSKKHYSLIEISGQKELCIEWYRFDDNKTKFFCEDFIIDFELNKYCESCIKNHTDSYCEFCRFKYTYHKNKIAIMINGKKRKWVL